MLDANPNHIQDWRYSTAAARGDAPPIPLVMIHDGGGTTFAYFSMDEVNRDMYGIHNPHYESGQPWVGGMEQMARTYVQLLKNARIKGKIFLGGWSMGGYLSIVMAHILAQEEAAGTGQIHVEGLLIIDSPMHLPFGAEQFQKANVGGWPKKVQVCYDQAMDLVRDWKLPKWRSCGTDAATKLMGQYIDQSLSITLPPAVLLRCTQFTPVKDPDKGPTRIDRFRNDRMLGWAERYPHFIKATLDVNAHHYNMFDFSEIPTTTEKINEALAILDKYIEMKHM